MKSYQTFEEDSALVALLTDCAKQKNLYNGSKLHADILRKGLLGINIVIGSTLVNMYAKCAALAKAQQVFDELSPRNIVSWNVLITGFAQHGHGEKALKCFQQMQGEGISPNAVTFTSILKACSSIGTAEKGKLIHDEIVRKGFLGNKIVLGTAIVDMYAKCGHLAMAQQMFDELPVRDYVSWNALIAGYAQHGHGKEALDCFEWMQREGLSPSAATFSCILKACGSLGATEKGKDIHNEIFRRGLLDKNVVLGNALVDMYAKCGALPKAQEVFNELPSRDIVSWTAIITGYCQHGHGNDALSFFNRMQQEGFSPNAVTLLCILQACGRIGDAEKGREIHAEIVRMGWLGKHCMLGNALVDMYAKCGALAKAREVFDKLKGRDKVSWTALITAYCQHRYGEEALKCFKCMLDEGLSADAVTYASVLHACGSMGATEKGKAIHAEIVKEGCLGIDSVLGTALMDFYAKCSLLAKAQEVFDELPVQTTVSWNALIGGYAQVGQYNAIFDLFKRMTNDGTEPDLVTFIVVLNACSYLGLVDMGQMYFEMMSTNYGIVPTVEHHTCMVDLYGHAGHFDKAMAVIKNMLSSDYIPVWFALLGACQKWGNVKLGRLSFERAVRLDKKSALAYACMSSIYAAAGMQENVDKIEAMRIENGAWTKPGHCWVDGLEVPIHCAFRM